MRIFDYDSAAREAGLSDDSVERLSAVIHREFPRDDMMFELHMLRACMAIRDGRITLVEALADEPKVTNR